VLNAIQQALKEIHQRVRLKDSRSNIELVREESKSCCPQGRIQLKAWWTFSIQAGETPVPLKG